MCKLSQLEQDRSLKISRHNYYYWMTNNWAVIVSCEAHETIGTRLMPLLDSKLISPLAVPRFFFSFSFGNVQVTVCISAASSGHRYRVFSRKHTKQPPAIPTHTLKQPHASRKGHITNGWGIGTACNTPLSRKKSPKYALSSCRWRSRNRSFDPSQNVTNNFSLWLH